MSKEDSVSLLDVGLGIFMVVIFGAMVLAGVVALADAVAGSASWGWATSAVHAAAAVVILAFVTFTVVASRRGLRDKRRLLNLGLFALWVAWAGVYVWTWHHTGSRAIQATVYVDNFSDQDVRVTRDGAAWLTCAKGSTQRTALPNGRHVLTVTSADEAKELDRFEVDVEKGKSYVLNCLGAQQYTSCEASYSVDGPGFAPRDDRVISDKWFPAPEDYLFEEPPSSIMIPAGSRTATKTFLRRGKQEEQIDPQTKRHAAAEADLRQIGRAYERGFGPTRAGRVVPDAPRGLEDLVFTEPLKHRGEYEVVGGYAGAFRAPEPDRRLAWQRQPGPDGKRLVLMGDFRTVIPMTPKEFAATRPVSSID